MNQTNKHVTVKDIIINVIGNVILEYTENDEFYNTCVTIKVYQGDSENAIVPISKSHEVFLELNIEEIYIYGLNINGENFVCLSKRF